MFRLIKILNGRTNQAEPCFLASTASEAYSLGEALTLADGTVTKCGATTRPAYIAQEDYTAPATGARPVSVFPVSADMIFECPLSATPTGLVCGDKVTLSATADGVTATKTNGVATIIDPMGAAAAGDKILVSFK